jgi:FkbM family methyltransferase
MGATRFSADPALIQALQSALPLDVFVETGTFQAATTLAMAPRFRRLYTIELSKDLFERARERLRHLPQVEALHGSSPVVLRELSPQLKDGGVVYWLDAHWCVGAGTAGSEAECPLLDELDAIGTLNERSVVLIDDARLFLAPPPVAHDASHWPRIDQVMQRLARLSATHAAYVINDVIVFAPPAAQAAVVAYARQHGAGQPAAPALNADLARAGRAERLFVWHMQRLGIGALLDVGSNSGLFARNMRILQFKGHIFSVEPLADAHRQVGKAAAADNQWVVLPRMAAGAEHGFQSINRSQNSVSSSLLPVHANHLRAEPATRTVATVRVFVCRTADIVHPALLATLEAVKIDVQGYEQHVLQGLLGRMAHVRLLQVELSMVPCYEGAPDMFALDRWIVGELGFERVALEPTYYDEARGIVQQYDGLYVRPDAPPRAAAFEPGVQPAAVVTSMAGIPRRLDESGNDVGEWWFGMCAGSWTQTAPQVISIAEVKPPFDAVRWAPCPQKPALGELLARMAGETEGSVVFVNSDILLTDDLRALLPGLHPEVAYVSHRIDVQSKVAGTVSAKGAQMRGLDVFVLPRSLLQAAGSHRDLLDRFTIGDPWWDYIVPVLALHLGYPVKRLSSAKPLALHHAHPPKFDVNVWRSFGRRFIDALRSLQAAGQGPAQGFIDDVLGTFDRAGDEMNGLHAVSAFVCGSLP